MTSPFSTRAASERRKRPFALAAFKSALAAALFNDRLAELDMCQHDSFIEKLVGIFADVGALRAAGHIDDDEANGVFADVKKFAVGVNIPLSLSDEERVLTTYQGSADRPLENAFPRPEEGPFRNDDFRPPFPVDVLPEPFWTFAHDTALNSGLSLDYLCAGVLSAAAAAMGRARVATTVLGTGYEQPPILWLACIGTSAAAKTPALGFSKKMLQAVEASLAPDNEDRKLAWKSRKAAADAARKQYEEQVKRAVGEGLPPPMMTADALEVPPLVKERIIINDPTPEAVIQICSGLPRGVLLFRDELAGWWNAFGRYSQGGGEREMWLEAHDGNSWSSERVKFGNDPVEVPALAVSIVGGTQPAKIRELLSGPADGLVERFLWFWPKFEGTETPTKPVLTGPCIGALKRLRSLDFERGEGDALKPRVVPLTSQALGLLSKFKARANEEARFADEQEAGAIGKADKQVIRLALVLEFMLWAATDEAPEPKAISERSIKGALILWNDYFKHHLRLVVGTDGGRAIGAARDLAQWILDNEVAEFTRTQVCRNAGRKSLRASKDAQAAIDELIEADWLFPNFSRSGGRKGRQKQEYIVNPHVHAGRFRAY
ncbi:DUF3987 domain-containing protein [Microvirga thermotolerans]|nr:DUF3987 domain-containing protein [Microvirga thermotolerans]